MKSRVSALLCGMLVVFGLSAAFAQDSNSDSKSKSDTRTMTGCLSKGGESNAKEFLLTASDGSTWEVRGDGVPLADHVGQTVSVTGAVKNATAHNLKEDAKDAATDAHMKKSNTEHGHMIITDVQKVSDSCQK
ncbi:MAG TPA: hypothetical protein VLL05_07480 [Terriglobales bacterium]|nr:hypothetical protein [Terriglobales bacterium]